MKKHFFVIVNYNSGENLISCIENILHSKEITPHIIIVDNASRDNSLEACKTQFPKLNYIYNTHNIGFAAGANSGTRFALERGATTVTFCNPDAILDNNCANTLIQTIISQKADIVSPLIYKYDEQTIWFTGGKISFYKQRATHAKKPLKKIHDLYATEYVSGCVMTVSSQVFKKTGLFDENFFLYYEDADLSLRAQNDDFKLAVNPGAIAWHKEVSETENPQKTYFLVLSGLIFFDKHSKGLKKAWFKMRLALRKIKNKSDIKKNKPLSKQVLKAYQDYDKRN